MDVWLRRCELILGDGRTLHGGMQNDWPAISVLVAQGHGWHMLVVTKSSGRLAIREQIMIGSTQNCFDRSKVLPVLPWVMEWAETVWRLWFLSLIADDDDDGSPNER
jgi:hypothetical protein